MLGHLRILVTGADGFIGSHLVELLVKNGASVKALSQYNSFNRWGWLDDIPAQKQIEVVSGDIRDGYFCRKIAADVDLIFHLAALIAIPYSYVSSASYIDTNVTGTLNICQAAREYGCRLIHTSTSEVYGTAQYVPIDENHPLQPQSPYSASKIGADALAMSFFNAFDLPVTIARPFNTYGPRQSARAIIPTMISQMAKGYKEIKLGNLTPTRDLNFVEDTCHGLMALAACQNAIGQTVNIGSNEESSMLDVFNLIKRIMGSDATLLEDEQRIRPEKSEVFRLRCNNDLLKKLTGFQPKYNLSTGLQKTCDWFSDPVNLEKYKPHLYNV